eukprot:TRINITY_DN30900_c0_g1_i1.p1 TRINITY_DN30900_c0_g1~~TRINITY_DN30900_c0_g1_i1.p1  ORF type:complete len:300 (+),score=1.46 TRINITY_DN30900_c0_g1_i1:40-939(+)
MSADPMESSDVPVELHEAVRNFEKQRQADKAARFRIVVRKGIWIFVAAIFVQVVARSLQLLRADDTFSLLLQACGHLLMGLAIIGLVAVPGSNINDAFRERPGRRRCVWLVAFGFSLAQVAEPVSGFSQAGVGTASVCLVPTVCVALYGLVHCTRRGGRCTDRPSATTLIGTWCVCYRGGQSLWLAFQGVGCKFYDTTVACLFPALFLLLVALARFQRRLRWFRTEGQDDDCVWPLNMSMFWVSCSYLCGCGETLVTGLMTRRLPDCVSFYARPWDEALLLGVLRICTYLGVFRNSEDL